MICSALDVDAWRRALRGAQAAELHRSRREREALAVCREEAASLERHRAAEREAVRSHEAAEQRCREQQASATSRFSAGVAGGADIVAALAHCQREKNKERAAATAAEQARSAARLQAEVEAEARRSWLQRRARLEVVRDAIVARRVGLNGAKEGLVELDGEEDAALNWNIRRITAATVDSCAQAAMHE
jgi:hypothetical protein